MPYQSVDGNDVVTAAAMRDAVTGAAQGTGPVVVEAATYRWHGHYEGDPQRYRSAEELQAWQEHDPVVLHRRRLLEAGIGRGRDRNARDQKWTTSSTKPSSWPANSTRHHRLRSPTLSSGNGL